MKIVFNVERDSFVLSPCDSVLLCLQKSGMNQGGIKQLILINLNIALYICYNSILVYYNNNKLVVILNKNNKSITIINSWFYILKIYAFCILYKF